MSSLILIIVIKMRITLSAINLDSIEFHFTPKILAYIMIISPLINESRCGFGEERFILIKKNDFISRSFFIR